MTNIEERAKKYSAKQTYFVGDRNLYKLVENIYEEAATEQARIDTEFFTEIMKMMNEAALEALKIAETDAILKRTEELNDNFVPDLTEYTANEMIDVLNGLINTRNPEPEQITMEYLQRRGFEKKDRCNGFVEFVKTFHIEKDKRKSGYVGMGSLGKRSLRFSFFKDIEGVEHITCRMSGRNNRVFEGEIKYVYELHAALGCVGLPDVSISME